MGNEVKRTELVWPGKYDKNGKRVEPPRVSLPFQVIERVNESRATRELKSRRGPTLFEVWEGDGGDAFEDGWRNKLIWGDNALVMSSLLEKFAGRLDLIYIDPPFATGADFSFEALIGDSGLEVAKQMSSVEERAYSDTWGRGLESFLEMMLQRLPLIRDLLSPSGTAFVHLDYRTDYLVRPLLDEVFGPASYVNELVWAYPASSAATRDYFIRSHQTIAMYAKDPNSRYFADDPLIYMPYSDRVLNSLKQDEEGRWYYLRGGSFAGKKLSDRVYVENPDRGQFPRDVWTDIPYVRARTDEYQGYETQKPERLLERIIASSSPEGGLVADFFVGSGTTAAVAEKLGRRWIACDLGRWAIHVSRKRVLGIEGCRPFEVLNLGRYERQHWQTVAFGDHASDRGQSILLEYIAFILKLYGAKPIVGSESLHGQRGKALVHVGSVDSPVTMQEVADAIEECLALKGREVHVLGWEWEMGLNDTMTEQAKAAGVRLVLRQIPREVMETQAAAKGDIAFHELAYLVAEVKPIEGRREYVVTLEDFLIPNPDLIPDDVRKKIKKWSDFVDYWAVDWEFSDDTFMQGWVTYRTRKDRTLALQSDSHTYMEPGDYTVMVKVIDIFGNDTSKIIRVKVK